MEAILHINPNLGRGKGAGGGGRVILPPNPQVGFPLITQKL